ncbi:unnamed protein product, partial [Owenia fusiformis]
LFKMAAPILKIFDTDKTVAQNLCSFVIDRANSCINSHGIFAVGVSGGSLAKFLCQGLPSLETDWSKWRLFFCDERHVAFDDPDSTYKVYKEGLMSKVPLAENHVFKTNPNVSVEDAAKEYITKVRSVLPGDELPRFDMLLLGMGPDGHTCSLFPGHPLLKETEQIVAPICDSPKPPPQRITLTLPVVNNTRCAVFASCGAGKAEMVKRVLEGSEEPPLPASQVRPSNGELYWFLDQPAASLLSKK